MNQCKNNHHKLNENERHVINQKLMTNIVNLDENIEDSLTKSERTNSKEERNKIQQYFSKLNNTFNNISNSNLQ